MIADPPNPFVFFGSKGQGVPFFVEIGGGNALYAGIQAPTPTLFCRAYREKRQFDRIGTKHRNSSVFRVGQGERRQTGSKGSPFEDFGRNVLAKTPVLLGGPGRWVHWDHR